MDLSKVDPSLVDARPFLGLGPLAPFQVERTQVETKVRIFWRRCLVWLVVLVVLGWVALSAGAYSFVRYQRGITSVTYVQVFQYLYDPAPYRRAKAEFFIEEGKAELAQKHYLKAFELLRMGLLQVPEDNEARFFVVEVFNVVGRTDLAAETLVAGLAYNQDSVAYVGRAFGYLFQEHQDDMAVEVAGRLLKAGGLDRETKRLVGLALATAHFNRGRYEQARAVIAEQTMSGTRSGALLSAQIMWEQDRHADALKLLAAMSEHWPDDAEIHSNYVSCLREEGLFEQWRLLGLARQFAKPNQTRGYVDELSALASQGERAGLVELEAACRRRFSEDAVGLKALSGYAAQFGRAELAGWIYQRCREVGMGADLAGTAWVESLVAAKEYQAALTAIRQMIADNPEGGRVETVLGGLKTVATYGIGEKTAADLLMESYLLKPNLRAEVLLPVATHLRVLGAEALLGRLLRRAVELSPLNRDALTQLIQWNLDRGWNDDLYPQVQRLMTLRKPQQEVLRRVAEKMQSDHFLMIPDREQILELVTQGGETGANG